MEMKCDPIVKGEEGGIVSYSTRAYFSLSNAIQLSLKSTCYIKGSFVRYAKYEEVILGPGTKALDIDRSPYVGFLIGRISRHIKTVSPQIDTSDLEKPAPTLSELGYQAGYQAGLAYDKPGTPSPAQEKPSKDPKMRTVKIEWMD